jgi:hypothetical protein
MKVHHSEFISALADGELKGLRRWMVQRHVSRCAACAAEYRHFRHVREMLAANPVRAVMSDSPEFFWSKVKRGIEASEDQTANVPVPSLSWSDWIGQHQFALATAVAMLIVAAGSVFMLRPSPKPAGHVAIIQPSVATVEHVSTMIQNSAATSFDATDSEPAVIWVTGLPWSPDMMEMKTRFAQLDT